MDTENTNDVNQLWFEYYAKEIDSADSSNFKKFGGYFLCPCCYLPTLTTRQGFEICSICGWEDDGQDDQNADKILGGPNSNYSLTEARMNFITYFTSYRPSDTNNFQRTTVKKTMDGKTIRDLIPIKKQAITEYNLAMLANNPVDRESHMKNGRDFENKLHIS
jgi:hypothetical protein